MAAIHSRREVLKLLSGAGAASLALGSAAHAEPPPETATVRLPQWIGGAYCWAAPYVAGELLRAEGFTDVQYVQGDPNVDQSVWIARGETDFSVNHPPLHITSIDAGVPVRVLTGLHAGCMEVIATDDVRSIGDLKGKRVGVEDLNATTHVMLTLMAAYVGLDPVRDIEWVVGGNAPELFAEGKIVAFIATPPIPQKLRAKKIGHVILNTATDPPWSQQFCCMLSATSDFVSKYPVAAKRVVRAMLKAADLCASNPELAARELVDRGFLPSYDYALQTLGDVRYDRWRDYDPEASLLFYALRMHEVGMIRKNPRDIIADGTDWRFIGELKRELKT
jgi:NitT/TauT family transport system substrate-binding protein